MHTYFYIFLIFSWKKVLGVNEAKAVHLFKVLRHFTSKNCWVGNAN